MLPYALMISMSLFLVSAVWFDHRSRRIPNVLVVAGIVCAMFLNFLSAEARGVGLSALGMLAGFGLFLPLHLLKVAGAGDVKLVAMVGAFVGLHEIAGTVLAVLVAGGGLAVVRMIGLRSGQRVAANLKLIVGRWLLPSQAGSEFLARRDTADGMPYAYAVAIGALGFQWFRQMGV